MTFSFTAAYSGLCPCGKYIRAGVSTIAIIDVPLPPDPHVCWYSADRGKWYIDNAEGNVRGRRYMHARCAAKLNGLSFEELELLAGDRRAELAAKKRKAVEDATHQHGRQRRARSKATS